MRYMDLLMVSLDFRAWLACPKFADDLVSISSNSRPYIMSRA